jgi:CDP-glycerol glycerophosphotransferase (TagB/SpsB family)
MRGRGRRTREQQAPVEAPLLSVVVPFHDASSTLARCVASLQAQTCARLEVLLVADGEDDAAGWIADELAADDPRVRVVRQRARGPAAARNHGVAEAHGRYLAFCDADDTVPPGGYAVLVEALERSGSDLVVGGLTVQDKGQHVRPPWLVESHAVRRLGVTLDSLPAVLAHPYLGPRVFRRSWWDAAALRFDETTSFPDLVLLTRALLAAARFDVVPATCYVAHERPDGRSLTQRSLAVPALGAERIDQAVAALGLLPAGPCDARRALTRAVLRTVVTDLVKYAVVRGPASWAALSPRVAALTATIPDEDWSDLPFSPRVLAWLCAHDDLEATGQFLEHTFENPTGFPTTLEHGRPVVHLAMLHELEAAATDLLSIAESELRYRTRLVSLLWTSPGVLEITGAAFVDYLTAADPGHSTTVLLVDRATGDELRLETGAAPDVDPNPWAGRGNEDLADAAFRAVLDVRALPPLGDTDRRRIAYDVVVEHRAAGRTRRDAFQVRHVEGAASLLESGGTDGVGVEPQWQRYGGLRLVQTSVVGAPQDPRAVGDAPATVHRLAVEPGHLEVSAYAAGPVELALHGPRVRTPWVRAEPSSGTDLVVARLPLQLDEWSLGPAALPTDRYHVVVRPAGAGATADVADAAIGHALWRSLPLRLHTDGLTVTPEAAGPGALRVRVTPQEWDTDAHPLARQRLREVVYPRARELPVREVALFETFAGKAGGDQPGALATELLRRRPGLDVVFSVIDRSVHVPAGARRVIRMSEEYVDLLARARYVVGNAGLPYFFRKREGQAFLQTWHGSPLKRIGHDRIHNDFANWHHRRQLVTASAQWDFLVSQSPFCTEKLRSAFHYSGCVLEEGYPRNDVLNSAERDAVRARVRTALGIEADARVVLYAPTWRDNLRSGAVYHKVLYLDPVRVAAELDCVVLVRGHYNSMKAAEEVSDDPRVREVTRYPDIADLYLAADAMVTDYSSAFFDFAAVDKPMVFLAPDLESYRDDNRGFYVDFHETVPGPVCETTDGVLAELVSAFADPTTGAARRAQFRRDFAPHDDGHASARVLDALLERFPATELPGVGV